MKEEPILNIIGVEIGGMFIHNDTLWTRTDRFVAKSVSNRSCLFGYLGSQGGSNDNEWLDYINNSTVLDFSQVEKLF